MDEEAAASGGDGPGRPERNETPGRRASGQLTGMVTEVLRHAGQPLTAGEVLDRLASTGAGPLAYTTVVTILFRLHEQGTADRFKAGRAYAYQAVTDPAQLAARRMRRLLDAEDDRAAVLAQFVGDLGARDETVIRELLGELATGRGDGAPGRRQPPGPDQ